jgi:hypothetical protein
MIDPQKVRRFMWFSVGISLSLTVLYLIQKFFGAEN